MLIVEIIKALINPFSERGALEKARQEWYKKRITEALGKGNFKMAAFLQDERDREVRK